MALLSKPLVCRYDDLEWFAVRGYWVIRKVPNTKDSFYVACGHPPHGVLAIYGINYE